MRHSGETQFAVLPVFSVLSSVVACPAPSLEGSGVDRCGSAGSAVAFRRGLARQTLAGSIHLWPVRVSRCVRPRMMSPQLWFSTVVVVLFCTLVDFRIRFGQTRRGALSPRCGCLSESATRGFQTHNPV